MSAVSNITEDHIINSKFMLARIKALDSPVKFENESPKCTNKIRD